MQPTESCHALLLHTYRAALMWLTVAPIRAPAAPGTRTGEATPRLCCCMRRAALMRQQRQTSYATALRGATTRAQTVRPPACTGAARLRREEAQTPARHPFQGSMRLRMETPQPARDRRRRCGVRLRVARRHSQGAMGVCVAWARALCRTRAWHLAATMAGAARRRRVARLARLQAAATRRST